MYSTLIFAATYNEIDNIEKYLFLANKFNKKIDILIVDDNSPDGTGIKLLKLKKKYKNLVVKIRKKKLGLNTAHKFAYRYALKKKYTKLVTMDADLSHNPKIIGKFIKELDKFKFVIGSRYMKGGRNELGFHRFLLSYFGNKIIRFFLNIECTEFTSSYRGFRLDKMKSFSLNSVNSKGYSFFMETLYLINRKKIQIKEIPIIFASRKSGKSKIPKIELFRTLKNVFFLSISK